MLHIYFSLCGQYVRIVCNNICITCTISEWSQAISQPGKFNKLVEEILDVRA